MPEKNKRKGFVFLNKPAGITSRAYLNQLLARFPGKAGLEGILDPFAEGLLIAAFGRTTSFLPYLHYFKKHYIGEIVFGVATDTDDATGQIIAYGKTEHITEEKISAVLENFQGELKQIPPAYSNVKWKGIRSHKLARSFVKTPLPERKVFIHEISLTPIEKPTRWQIEVKVSKGTYIRALARDLGYALGTVAHLRRLVRMAIGPIHVEQSLQVENLQEKDFLPEDTPFLECGKLELIEKWYWQLRKGQKINIEIPPGLVRLYWKGKFLGLGNSDGKFLYPERIPRR